MQFTITLDQIKAILQSQYKLEKRFQKIFPILTGEKNPDGFIDTPLTEEILFEVMGFKDTGNGNMDLVEAFNEDCTVNHTKKIFTVEVYLEAIAKAKREKKYLVTGGSGHNINISYLTDEQAKADGWSDEEI